MRYDVMVASEILILFVKVRVLMSHQILYMTFEVVLAKTNQIRLATKEVKKTIKKKESRADRLLLLIYQNQQKLIDAKRKSRRKWYQIF